MFTPVTSPTVSPAPSRPVSPGPIYTPYPRPNLSPSPPPVTTVWHVEPTPVIVPVALVAITVHYKAWNAVKRAFAWYSTKAVHDPDSGPLCYESAHQCALSVACSQTHFDPAIHMLKPVTTIVEPANDHSSAHVRSASSGLVRKSEVHAPRPPK